MPDDSELEAMIQQPGAFDPSDEVAGANAPLLGVRLGEVLADALRRPTDPGG